MTIYIGFWTWLKTPFAIRDMNIPCLFCKKPVEPSCFGFRYKCVGCVGEPK